MKNTSPATTPKHHAEAFASLRAEREAAWLAEVFCPPEELHAMDDARSLVVFGGGGSGKSALRLALTQRGVEAAPPRLVVHWAPSLPLAGDGPDEQVHACMEQIFAACAEALITQATRESERFRLAPGWVLTILHWFIRRYFQKDIAFYLSRLEAESKPRDLHWVQEWLAQPPRPVLGPNMRDKDVIAELASALQRIDLAGAWVLVDGMEPWINLQPEPLGKLLMAMLSSLALFEDPGFAIKLMAPAGLRPQLMSATGVISWRLDVYDLNWPVLALKNIVERRLAWASGRSSFALSQLCSSDSFLQWLERYGGQSPRIWLELVRPLFDAYLLAGGEQALDEARWQRIIEKHPPKIRLDLNQKKVYIGAGEIAGLQPKPYQVLRYLYLHPQRRSSRNELYYRAYLGLDHEPHAPGDKGWEDQATISKNIDTAIWRLRQAIEPEPDQPRYLITERGKWVWLDNAW